MEQTRGRNQQKSKGLRLGMIVLSSLILLVALICFAPKTAWSWLPLGERTAGSECLFHMIDVGTGDAILLVSDGEAMLVDAGDATAGERVATYCRWAGVDKLDKVIISHPHADHLGGMTAVLSSLPYDELYLNPPCKEEETEPNYQALRSLLNQQGRQPKTLSAGDSFPLGGAKVRVIGPLGDFPETNNQSLVLLVEHQGHKFLLTGDMEMDAEKRLLMEGCLEQVDLLKVAHHGSKGATGTRFLNEIRPTYALISVEQGNRHGHPAKELMNRLEESGAICLLTMTEGDIRFSSRQGSLKRLP